MAIRNYNYINYKCRLKDNSETLRDSITADVLGCLITFSYYSTILVGMVM